LRDWAGRSSLSEPDHDNAELERQTFVSLALETKRDASCTSGKAFLAKPSLAWLASRTDRIMTMLLGLLIVAVVVPNRSLPPVVLIALTVLLAAAFKQFGSASVALAKAETRTPEP